jgi:hypothetical protein
VMLLKNRGLRDRITKNAKVLLEKNFRWERNLGILDKQISFIGMKPVIHNEYSSSGI